MTGDREILFICPTYAEAEHHRYTLRAIRSFLKYTPGGYIVVLDDASPDWSLNIEESLCREIGEHGSVAHFKKWGGVTRTWNKGLELARDTDFKYTLCSNNDVVFTEGWYRGLVKAITDGYALAGPVSNAPGITAHGKAEVWQYLPDYQLRDDQVYLDQVAQALQGRKPITAPVNGFCQLARTKTWWSGAFDPGHVFKPRNDVTSEGRKNLTPLMTLNEDELQGRWAKMGRTTAVCPSSFVFHYRAVTRGARYHRGRWYRAADPLAGA